MAQVKLYNEILVSYDITDTAQRTKLFKKLKDISLTAIQKLVFWGYLNKAEEEAVKRMLKIYCDKGDKAFIARVKLAGQIQQNNSIGYDKQDFPEHCASYHVI